PHAHRPDVSGRRMAAAVHAAPAQKDHRAKRAGDGFDSVALTQCLHGDLAQGGQNARSGGECGGHGPLPSAPRFRDGISGRASLFRGNLLVPRGVPQAVKSGRTTSPEPAMATRALTGEASGTIVAPVST